MGWKNIARENPIFSPPIAGPDFACRPSPALALATAHGSGPVFPMRKAVKGNSGRKTPRK